MRQVIKQLAFIFIHLVFIPCTDAQVKPIILGNPKAIVYDMKLMGQKELLVASLGDKIELWNYRSKLLMNSWSSSKIIAIDYFDNRLAGVSKSGNIFFWSIPGGEETLQLKVSDSPLICIAWLDSVYVAVGSDQGEIIKINSITGEIVSQIKNSAAITAMSLGQEKTLITGDAKGILATYNTKEMQPEKIVKGHKRWIRQIVASDSIPFFITTSDDGHYKRWNSVKQISSTGNLSLGSWLLCGDLLKSAESKFSVMAFGKRNGEIIVLTRFGNYTSKLKSMINSIAIIPNNQQLIHLAIATHGEGIQLVDTFNMKLESK